ncbi:hypothetical protein BGZ95_000590 [Linnemannia exigua]|uniref:UspA domain-containing protein n=1 Tax=Linnemannia exigua TaxID=604196 RepID=A0AAD4D823_9FUNG|nr:hypothetical protein BGZ95_000590 [Linnemannia exigua]
MFPSPASSPSLSSTLSSTTSTPIGSPTNSTTTSLSTNPDPHHAKDNLSANSPASTTPRTTEAPPKQRSKNGYIARVGFDTLGCDTPAEYAFTLQARTDGWRRTRRSRTFLVGTDLNEYSSHALQWVMENMVEDGDEIVALRVVPIELRDSFAKSGIPSFQGQEVAARSEATKIMEMIREKNRTKKKQVNIVVEYVVGAVRDTIQHMIKMYEPSMLVVGTRGRSSVKGFLLGSVSRYLLNHSPVPVTVVRPASKLIKSKTKAKGIFRRRSSAVGFDATADGSGSMGGDQHIQVAPQLFYSSPLSRQTSRASVDEGKSSSSGQNAGDLERVRSRSPEPSHHHHHHGQQQTAAARASAAKRPSKGSIFAPMALSTTLTPPSPAASIQSSLSFASAMLSDNADDDNNNGNKRPPPPPEGMLKLRKSVTTDGSMSSTSSSGSKKSGRRSMAFLWAPLSLGKEKKKRASEV